MPPNPSTSTSPTPASSTPHETPTSNFVKPEPASFVCRLAPNLKFGHNAKNESVDGNLNKSKTKSDLKKGNDTIQIYSLF
jgi:hypothetical protein